MDEPAGRFFSLAGNVMVLYGADIVTIDRNARDYRLPDQFKWNGSPGADNQTSLLYSDPSKPGL